MPTVGQRPCYLSLLGRVLTDGSMGRITGSDLSSREGVEQRIGIVSLVAEECARVCVFEQRATLLNWLAKNAARRMPYRLNIIVIFPQQLNGPLRRSQFKVKYGAQLWRTGRSICIRAAWSELKQIEPVGRFRIANP